MRFASKMFVCAWLTWMSVPVWGQQSLLPGNYPATTFPQFSESNRNDWPVSAPVPDAMPNDEAARHRSMSPDSWGTVPTISQQFVPESPQPSSNRNDDEIGLPTPSVPDLKATSPRSRPQLWKATYGTPGTREPSDSTGTAAKPSNQSQYQWSSDVSPDGLRNRGQDSSRPRYPLESSQDIGPAKSTAPMNRNPTSFDEIDDWYETPTRSIYSTGDPSELSANPIPARSGVGISSPSVGFVQTNQGPANPIPGQPPFVQNQSNFRPELGQRSPEQTVRYFGANESTLYHGFEDKSTPPPRIRETLSTGRYFVSATAMYLKPAFNTNTAITNLGPGIGEATPFDFDYESAPAIRFGFESKKGQGIELNYWRYDESSNVARFTQTGTNSAIISSQILGSGRWTNLSAANPGESLSAVHSMNVDSIGATLFKQYRMSDSRLVGRFGLRWIDVKQTLGASLSNGAATLGQLNSRSDLRGFGPSCGLEYHHRIGKTRLELVTTAGGALLFGQRDQFIQNTLEGSFDRIGADEFLSTADLLAGLAYRKQVGENQSYFAQLGITYQTWIGGGTGTTPEGDFGLHGFSFSLGYNR